MKNQSRVFVFIVFAIACLISGKLLAYEVTELEDSELNDEYEDISDELEAFDGMSSEKEPSLLDDLILTLRHELGYTAGVEDKLNTNRSSIRLQWQYSQNNWLIKADAKSSYDFAFDGDEIPSNIKKTYQQQNRLRELYIKTTLGNTSIALGRQVVIWGKADGAQVTDIISPRNLTESIFIPIEDARLGQTMLVVSGYNTTQNLTGNTQHEWSFVINPDKRPNEIALPGHPYAMTPTQAELPQNISIEEDKPAFSWRSPEVGFRWARTQGKLDTAVMIARVHDNNPTLFFNPLNLSVKPSYERYTMLGAGFNLADGAIVWKGELAKKNGRRLNCLEPPICLLDSKEYHFWDAALGIDYNANGAYTASIEISNQHIVNWDKSLLGLERNRTVAYGSINKTWLNETLNSQYTQFYDLQGGDALHRILLEYDISDYWKTGFQIDYFDVHKKETLLSGLYNKHRLALTIEGNF